MLSGILAAVRGISLIGSKVYGQKIGLISSLISPILNV